MDECVRKRDLILNNIIKVPFEYITQEPYEFLQSSAKKNIIVDVKSRGLVNGFVFCADIYYLTEIKLYINDELYLDYDVFDVNNLCRLLTNKTVFLSLVSSLTTQNGEHRINRYMDFSNFKTCELHLKFINSQEDFSIYSIQEGLMSYQSERISIEKNSYNINSILSIV